MTYVSQRPEEHLLRRHLIREALCLSTALFIPQESAPDAILKLNLLRTNYIIKLRVHTLTYGFLICEMVRILALPMSEGRMRWHFVS